MIIRRARTDERDMLEDLMLRASLADDAYRRQLEENTDAIVLPEPVLAGDLLVADTKKGIAGFAAITEGELRGLFVEPGDQRRGVGRALVEAAVHEARRLGLSLVTVVASPATQAFYEKCGFRIEGEASTRFGPAVRMSR